MFIVMVQGLADRGGRGGILSPPCSQKSLMLHSLLSKFTSKDRKNIWYIHITPPLCPPASRYAPLLLVPRCVPVMVCLSVPQFWCCIWKKNSNAGKNDILLIFLVVDLKTAFTNVKKVVPRDQWLTFYQIIQKLKNKVVLWAWITLTFRRY
jgi:hypothetical protein